MTLNRPYRTHPFWLLALSAALVIALLCPGAATAQADSAPKILVVTAHPDDHAEFAAVIYKITHDLGGVVDLVVITNGEGGFKYSTLAESYYGLELTDSVIGRQYLPGIRKKEAIAGGTILGIRNYLFFDQPDHSFTLSADSVLRFAWDTTSVKARLRQLIATGGYDYIFCLLPTETTHGGHKAATIVTLEVVKEMPIARRPVILAGSDSTKGQPPDFRFTALPGYPVTSVRSGGSSFHFDKTQKFGYHDVLDYKIVVNWMIAEHKSQGTMQLLMNVGDVENYWFFDVNDPAKIAQTQALFDRLKVLKYKRKTY
jgi:LmbE family N-acetylglucosaminyl deacetylase